MSENQNRGIRDFSKYDTMSTEELEEILRLDSEAPMEQESDTELLLYIMGVLASRPTQNTAGKTAFESWKAFQQNYLSEDEEIEQLSAEDRKPRKIHRWSKWLTAAAAMLVLVVGFSVTVGAMGWDAMWSAVATWANDTFSFTSIQQPDNPGPSPNDTQEYSSLQEALKFTGQDYDFVPTWIPDGYQLEEVVVAQNPIQSIYAAQYIKEKQFLKISVRNYHTSDPEKIEINDSLLECYKRHDVEYYILANNAQLRAVWLNGSYECYISGDLTIEEMKTMIDSIGKG